jgi:molybdopterin synthase catalytic subunit
VKKKTREQPINLYWNVKLKRKITLTKKKEPNQKIIIHHKLGKLEIKRIKIKF